MSHLLSYRSVTVLVPNFLSPKIAATGGALVGKELSVGYALVAAVGELDGDALGEAVFEVESEGALVSKMVPPLVATLAGVRDPVGVGDPVGVPVVGAPVGAGLDWAKPSDRR